MDTKFRLIFLFLFFTNMAFGQTGYKTVIKLKDLSNKTLLQKMQNNATKLISELNYAFFENRKPELQNSIITEDAREILISLWETSPFRCSETLIIERVLKINFTKTERYQVRNIPIIIKDLFEIKSDTSNNEDDRSQEISLTFNSAGIIENILYSLEANSYKELMNEGLGVDDKRKRQFLIEFIENMQTAYIRKDIDFLEKIYSDGIIIIDNVIKNKPINTSTSLTDVNIRYQQQTKQEYIKKLRDRIFKSNRYINIKFDEIKITQDRFNPEIYGLNLRQSWNTTYYSDVGYLFFMFDFMDEYNPIIHVRTWQPEEAKNSEEGLYDLSSFEIIK